MVIRSKVVVLPSVALSHGDVGGVGHGGEVIDVVCGGDYGSEGVTLLCQTFTAQSADLQCDQYAW